MTKLTFPQAALKLARRALPGAGAGWLTLAALLALPAAAFAQTVNPLESNPRAAAAGGTLFRAQCATCHGADARGIEDIQAPDLTRLWSLPGRSDGTVFQTIREGVPGSIMPPHSFTDTETWMLVSYLKSIGVGNVADSYTGNVARGAGLFAANCDRCHRVNGEGGTLGPDLTRITASRSRQSLLVSVRDPSASLVRNYRPVRLVTGDGRQFRGTIKSEDAFSIQIMDSSQSLRGFRKADLTSLQYEERSLMPQFTASALSDSQLEDILTFLAAQAARATN